MKRAQGHGVVDLFGKQKNTEKIAQERGADYKINRVGNIILNDDNEESRRMVEHCYRTRKTLINPIVDWEEEDVWEFLNGNGIEHCCLYDQGNKRLGCIGCPMSTSAAADLERYPTYKRNYIRAFDRMLANNKKRGIEGKANWKDGESVMRWWLKEDPELTQEQAEELMELPYGFLNGEE